jgi:hypothetical protein
MKNTITLHGRRHNRYSLDLLEITGEMSLSRKVNILDMSLEGVALKADHRLDLGREYMINLRNDKGKTLIVAGVVVRAELSEMEKKDDEDSVSLYRVGLQFKDGSADAVDYFLQSTAHTLQGPAPSRNDHRHTARFHMTASNEQILSYPAHFRVRSISLGGMLIETEQALEAESTVPMEMTLNDGSSVKVIARISSCRLKKNDGPAHYEIVSEFIDLTEKDKVAIERFIAEWGSFLTSSRKDPVSGGTPSSPA